MGIIKCYHKLLHNRALIYIPEGGAKKSVKKLLKVQYVRLLV